jgi:hypothetical protein
MVASRRELMAEASSEITRMKRSRKSASISGESSRVSTAARMLPSAARLPSVRDCKAWSRSASRSKLRVMFSMVRT